MWPLRMILYKLYSIEHCLEFVVTQFTLCAVVCFSFFIYWQFFSFSNHTSRWNLMIVVSPVFSKILVSFPRVICTRMILTRNFAKKWTQLGNKFYKNSAKRDVSLLTFVTGVNRISESNIVPSSSYKIINWASFRPTSIFYIHYST